MSTFSLGVRHVVFKEAPESFQPLKTTRSLQTSQDLSDHVFTADEKQILVQQMTSSTRERADPLLLENPGKDAY